VTAVALAWTANGALQAYTVSACRPLVERGLPCDPPQVGSSTGPGGFPADRSRVRSPASGLRDALGLDVLQPSPCASGWRQVAGTARFGTHRRRAAPAG